MTRPIHLQIDPDRCGLCPECLAASACKVRAIVRLDPDEAPFIDFERCYDCRLCLPACAFGAISIR
jgi:Fe-S-cluster-containing hydrogenase component 2